MNNARRHRRVRSLRAATLHNLAHFRARFRPNRADFLHRVLFLLIWGVASVASTAAWAVTINSLTWNPAQYTYPGTVITFTMTFNTDSRAWNSASFSDTGGTGITFNLVSCTPAPNGSTGQSVSCDFSYTTTTSDRSNLQFIPQVTVDGLDSVTWSGGIAQINYVAPPAASISLSSSVSPSTSGQNVTFTATVSGDGTHGTPTGTVDFYDGKGTFSQTVTLAGGSASYTSNALPAGTNTVYASYSGSAYYSASSTSITQTVSGTSLSLNSTLSAQTQGRTVLQPDERRFWRNVSLQLLAHRWDAASGHLTELHHRHGLRDADDGWRVQLPDQGDRQHLAHGANGDADSERNDRKGRSDDQLHLDGADIGCGRRSYLYPDGDIVVRSGGDADGRCVERGRVFDVGRGRFLPGRGHLYHRRQPGPETGTTMPPPSSSRASPSARDPRRSASPSHRTRRSPPDR